MGLNHDRIAKVLGSEIVASISGGHGQFGSEELAIKVAESSNRIAVAGILIVSHCWNPSGCMLYAQHLRWQISSLIHWPPSVPVRLVLCHASSKDDPATWQVLRGMRSLLPDLKRVNVQIDSLQLGQPMLFRRAIGRNMAAMNCGESIVWFCDLDYCFGEGCLDSLAEQVGPDDELVWPQEVLVNIDHATGDKMVNDNLATLLPRPDLSLFMPLARDRAIGGLQICGGNVARQRGYLDGTKWVEPVDASKGFHQTDEDPKFRHGRKARAIKLPNLYWIRHSFKGAWVA